MEGWKRAFVYVVPICGCVYVVNVSMNMNMNMSMENERKSDLLLPISNFLPSVPELYRSNIYFQVFLRKKVHTTGNLPFRFSI